MAAFTTPESVTGVPMFVPSANNFFTLVAAGMPNGDDCLQINGTTSNDALAVTRAPITPSILNLIFNSTMTTGDQYAMTFWIKATDPGTPTGKLFTCKDWAGNYNTGSVGGGGSSLDRWWVALSESGGLLRMTLNRRQSRDGIHARVADVSYGAWHLVTFNIAGTASVNILTMDSYIDDSVSGVTGNVSVSGAFSVPLLGYPHFTIGGYASGFDGPDAVIQLGKIVFWDHALALVERQSLYGAMMDPCA